MGISYTIVTRVKELAEAKQYGEALDLLEGEDIYQSLNPQFLRCCGKVYLETAHYFESRNALVRAHIMAPEALRIIYDLTHLYLKMGYYTRAKKYFSLYQCLASHGDLGIKQLEYMLKKAERKQAKDLLIPLKEVCDEEYSDDWGFELALLYASLGMEKEKKDECIHLMAAFRNSPYYTLADSLKKDEYDISNSYFSFPLVEVEEDIKLYAELTDIEEEQWKKDDVIVHPPEPVILMMEDEEEEEEEEKPEQKQKLFFRIPFFHKKKKSDSEEEEQNTSTGMEEKQDADHSDTEKETSVSEADQVKDTDTVKEADSSGQSSEQKDSIEAFESNDWKEAATEVDSTGKETIKTVEEADSAKEDNEEADSTKKEAKEDSEDTVSTEKEMREDGEEADSAEKEMREDGEEADSAEKEMQEDGEEADSAEKESIEDSEETDFVNDESIGEVVSEKLDEERMDDTGKNAETIEREKTDHKISDVEKIDYPEETGENTEPEKKEVSDHNNDKAEKTIAESEDQNEGISWEAIDDNADISSYIESVMKSVADIEASVAEDLKNPNQYQTALKKDHKQEGTKTYQSKLNEVEDSLSPKERLEKLMQLIEADKEEEANETPETYKEEEIDMDEYLINLVGANSIANAMMKTYREERENDQKKNQ